MKRTAQSGSRPTRTRTGFTRGAVGIALTTAVVAAFLLLFGFQSYQRVKSVENHWINYSQDAVKASGLLQDVSMHMGFGGFIHDYKTYVLHRDVEGLARLLEDQAALHAYFDELEGHILTAEEQAALDTVQATYREYRRVAERAYVAFSTDPAAVEVDFLLSIDDAPAKAAFDVLKTSFQNRQALAQMETQKALNAAASMTLLLLLSVPVVVLLGVLLVLFFKRIVDGNARLSEVRDELASLLRQAPDAILHVAEEGRIIRVNDRAVQLFGYPRDEFLKLTVEDLVPQGMRGSHAGIREKAFDGMADRPIGDGADLMAVTRDGREVPVEISLSFATSGGKRFATAIVRDITDRKRAEDVLRETHTALEERVRERTRELEQRTEQLESEMTERKRAQDQLIQSAKMATIGEMASGITHELNQPMNIMRMGVEAAQIRIQRGQADLDYVAETLSKVEDQIVRMSDIITHMRAYSRQDTEGQIPFKPGHAVLDGCNLFSAQLLGDDIAFDVDVEKDLPLVKGHANRLEQVILNLLSNARDAIKMRREKGVPGDDDRIRVVVRADRENANLIIRVEDTGGGVPKEVLPHIFAPFVTTKDSGRGTGLGLSISFGIIEGMDGTIEVMNLTRGSRVEGARFSIQLPFAEEQTVPVPIPGAAPGGDGPSADAARTDGAPQGNGIEKVLVVDDEVGAAHSLSDFLQELGYLVYTAYNGEEALRLFESDPADVVISDLRMPVMSGEDLARALRADDVAVPIFIMTGHGTGDGGVRMPDGATDVWRKPLSLTDVAQKLQAL